jgi:peroxiredoxin
VTPGLLLAPEPQVERWFNSDKPMTLAGLRGKVVVLHAFQMLCPGCVSHAIPQVKRLHELARRNSSGLSEPRMQATRRPMIRH